MGTLGLALILLGLMAWRAPIGGAFARFLPLPSSTHHYSVLGNHRQPDADHLPRARVRAHRGDHHLPARDQARHGDARARERPRDHRHARRARAARGGGGVVRRRASSAAAAGLLLPDLLTSLDYSALTFLVIASLAAALIGRLRSLWVTLFGGLAVGVLPGRDRPDGRVDYAFMREISKLPRGGAVRARDHRAALPVAAPRRHDLADRATRACERCAGSRAELAAAARAAARPRIGDGRRGRDRRAACSLALVAVPTLVGSDWITTFTSVAIYSVVALGFGVLYGRVGHDLARPGRPAFARRLDRDPARLRDLDPVSALLIVVGAITCVIGVLVGLPAHPALGALPRPDHADVRRAPRRSCCR